MLSSFEPLFRFSFTLCTNIYAVDIFISCDWFFLSDKFVVESALRKCAVVDGFLKSKDVIRTKQTNYRYESERRERL
jgi:hypothetical protein